MSKQQGIKRHKPAVSWNVRHKEAERKQQEKLRREARREKAKAEEAVDSD